MDQTAEPPLNNTHQQQPEEVQHHENGASKMFRKVKARAKKFKNNITKHDQNNEHDHDVVEEDDEDDELEPEEIDAPERREPPTHHPAPGGGSDYLSGVSNYQSKVTDPTHKGGEAEVPEIAESLSRMKVTDESPDQKSRQGFGEDLPTRSQEFGLKNESDISKDSPARLGGESTAGLGEDFQRRSDDVKAETGLGRDLPTGTHDQFSPELSRPKERDDFEETRDETKQETKPSTYAEQLASATSAITNKAIAAKNVVASKLGYSGESGGGQYESAVMDETPRSATGYGQKVAVTVAEKLTPVYEKFKETGSTVMTKLSLSGGGSGVETQQGEEKGVSTRDYLSEKLRPGEEDKALSEVIAEKLHFGGGGEKKSTATKEVDVTVEKIPSDQISKGC